MPHQSPGPFSRAQRAQSAQGARLARLLPPAKPPSCSSPIAARSSRGGGPAPVGGPGHPLPAAEEGHVELRTAVRFGGGRDRGRPAGQSRPRRSPWPGAAISRASSKALMSAQSWSPEAVLIAPERRTAMSSFARRQTPQWPARSRSNTRKPHWVQARGGSGRRTRLLLCPGGLPSIIGPGKGAHQGTPN